VGPVSRVDDSEPHQLLHLRRGCWMPRCMRVLVLEFSVAVVMIVWHADVQWQSACEFNIKYSVVEEYFHAVMRNSLCTLSQLNKWVLAAA